MANKKYVNNEKDGWNQECEEDLLKLLDEVFYQRMYHIVN